MVYVPVGVGVMDCPMHNFASKQAAISLNVKNIVEDIEIFTTLRVETASESMMRRISLMKRQTQDFLVSRTTAVVLLRPGL